MQGPTTDVRLISVPLDTLRPTQITVGYHEVEVKRAHWKSLDKKARAQAISTHWFPAVLGPGEQHFIVDHHHLGLALIEEGESRVPMMMLRDLSWLEPAIFWRMMEHFQWVHPFGPDGTRHDYGRLPTTLTELVDDPYRSLAGELRRIGGFAKDTTPFSEFLWADYLRPKISEKRIRKDFDKALKAALACAHDPDARYLPGWSGAMAAPAH
ncbi:ParB-like protein [Trinickia acidisoli]|uniref:ParB-like protein n=1 Tax=Trinickia acidisoli TaxID=2767482 RepID=UPI001A90B83A|nr:ParB-like protein [Trinickia acidisoli]